MAGLISDRELFNAPRRVLDVFRNAGVARGLKIFAAALDDRQLRHFDRVYGIHTSGIIELEQTSFSPSRLHDATCYGPVNGWGFRRFLRTLRLSKHLHFADLGSGLGRACIVAAEYGFERVTGVELVSEFCASARENIARCHPPHGRLSPITILEMDVIAYCDRADDDVFFMYRPFSQKFFCAVLDQLADRARAQGKVLMIIFSERVALSGSLAYVIADREDFSRVFYGEYWGQAFWVYQCGAEAGLAPGR